jgi:hypothetical protein
MGMARHDRYVGKGVGQRRKTEKVADCKRAVGQERDLGHQR